MAAQLPAGTKEGPLLLQQPTLSRTQVAFVFAGDLWIVERDGGDAKSVECDSGAALICPSGRPRWSREGNAMRQVEMELPDNVAQQLEIGGRDLSRRALEALAVEAYRSGEITPAQVQ